MTLGPSMVMGWDGANDIHGLWPARPHRRSASLRPVIRQRLPHPTHNPVETIPRLRKMRVRVGSVEGSTELYLIPLSWNGVSVGHAVPSNARQHRMSLPPTGARRQLA